MRTHNLTNEQMQKFIDAVGGNLTIMEARGISGGQYTTEELEKLANSCAGLSDWPKHTDDPLVNFIVDCVVAGDDETTDYDAQLYTDEVKAFAALHG